ncbi:MAG: hypothetical protein N2505_04145 [Endomicrobia bacterium]|nr:hypothetical protein [Endomicrobiia bacterium]
MLKKNKGLFIYIFLILNISLYSEEIETPKENLIVDEYFILEDKEESEFPIHKLKTHIRFRFLYDENYLEKNNSLYFSNKTQLSYNDSLVLGYLFIHKPQEVEITPETFRYFLRKWWLEKMDLFFIDKIVVGNYRVNFGYGVIFSENSYISKFVQYIKPKDSRISGDSTSSDNANFYGIAVEDNIGDFKYITFFSQKNLILKNTDYFVNDDLIALRNEYVEYDKELLNLSDFYIKEVLYGCGFLFSKKNIKFGLCSFYTIYDKIFDPNKMNISGYLLEDKYSDRWHNVFRGKELAGGSLYSLFLFDNITFFSEIGKSFSRFQSENDSLKEGNGVNFGFIFPFKAHKFYLIYTYLSSNFYSPFGNPFKIYKYPNTQEGIKLVNLYNFDKLQFETSFSICKIFESIWSGHIYCDFPRYPSLFQYVVFKFKYNLGKIIFETKNSSVLEEKYINLSKYGIFSINEYSQEKFLKINSHFEIQYKIFENTFLGFKYQKIWQNLIKYQRNYYVENLSLNFLYRIEDFEVRFAYDIPDIDKNIYFINLEPIWKGTYIFRSYDLELLEKSSIIFGYDTKKISFWGKLGYSQYFQEFSKYEIRFQLDFKF